MGDCAALRGVGNTRTTMYVNITANVSIIFNYFLINGIVFPRLEVKGAAIATVTGFQRGVCRFALYTVFSRRHGTYLQHRIRRDDWRSNATPFVPSLKWAETPCWNR